MNIIKKISECNAIELYPHLVNLFLEKFHFNLPKQVFSGWNSFFKTMEKDLLILQPKYCWLFRLILNQPVDITASFTATDKQNFILALSQLLMHKFRNNGFAGLQQALKVLKNYQVIYSLNNSSEIVDVYDDICDLLSETTNNLMKTETIDSDKKIPILFTTRLFLTGLEKILLSKNCSGSSTEEIEKILNVIQKILLFLQKLAGLKMFEENQISNFHESLHLLQNSMITFDTNAKVFSLTNTSLLIDCYLDYTPLYPIEETLKEKYAIKLMELLEHMIKMLSFTRENPIGIEKLINDTIHKIDENHTIKNIILLYPNTKKVFDKILDRYKQK
mgnify:CR=1 FL=1